MGHIRSCFRSKMITTFPLSTMLLQGMSYIPGHTAGSMSLLLETGEAFVDDAAASGFPLRMGPDLPAFAFDLEGAKRSLSLPNEGGAKAMYPAMEGLSRCGSLKRFSANSTIDPFEGHSAVDVGPVLRHTVKSYHCIMVQNIRKGGTMCVAKSFG